MEHLFDTCTIKHELKTDTVIFAVAEYCSNIKEPFTISSVIKNELRPPNTLSKAEYEKASRVNAYIERYIKSGHIKVIDISTENTIKLNFNKLRQCHYGWMTRGDYCKHLIETGELTLEEYKSPGFRNRDAGECSLIAIALTSPKSYVIISEDKGVVFSHPHINIFDVFKSKGLNIVKFKEWLYYSDVMSGGPDD
ncbi:hypothetical protein SAMN02745823_03797 [Sporobacter termitidis DSM 10068]|uniref:PIN domain-containing protein n=1 Tax=Sporobacter termitidis DSM 10068 TaxID=1123282 RepID=A0A1M5ZIG2_9FIRM|nr:hypothetical protein [Sporobacter termitidis]SHI24087.1 hypothetical protein SAMN02745823_03797 [Sporobacter termitidis DSM 10068]